MKTKRLLSLLLALCMALGCLSLGVLADDEEGDPEEPTPGTPEWCEANGGHLYGVDGHCVNCYDYDSAYDQGIGDEDECQHEFGNDGVCEICGEYDASEDLSVVGDPLTLGVSMIEPPAFVAWSSHAFTPTADGVYLFSSSCDEDMEIQLYNGSMFIAEDWGHDCSIAAELTGETEYTLKVRYTSESDMGASVLITVSIQALESAGALSVGNNSLATTDDRSWTLYTFTPAETGCYRFRSQGVHDPDAKLVDIPWTGSNDVDSGLGNQNFNFLTDCQLTADVPCLFLIKNCNSASLTIPVIVERVADPESETIPSCQVDEDGWEFDEGYFTYYGLPEYGTPAWCEAKGHDWDSETGECRLCGAQCRHDRYWDDGTCRVCGCYDEAHDSPATTGAVLRLGENALTLRGSRGWTAHAFTPAESGFYRFRSDTASENADPRCELYDDEGDFIESADDVSSDNRDFRLELMLTAGKTYTLRLTNLEKTEDARNAAVTVEKIDLSDALHLGENDAVIGCFYTFTPPENGRYAFFSTGDYDTKGTLWSPEGEQLESNDDPVADEEEEEEEEEGEPDRNFRFSSYLTAGAAYVFKLDGSEDDLGMPCAVTVEQTELTAWETLQQLLDGEAPTVKLTQDCIATKDDVCLKVPADRDVTLDLNGNTLDGSALDSSDVLLVNGALTLKDSAGGGSLVADGGDDAVYVDGGSFTMIGGTISVTGADFGAVFVDGSVVINGGAISADNAVHMASGTLNAAAPISVTAAWGFTDGTNVYPAGSLTQQEFRDAGLAGKTLYLFGVSGRWDGDLLTAQYNAPAGSLLIAAAYDESGRQASVWSLGNPATRGAASERTGLFRRHGAIFKLLLVDSSYAPLCDPWENNADND